MSGWEWLNNFMTWLGRWVPRIVLVRQTHRGVMFGRNGTVWQIEPGLVVYWPITHELQLVEVNMRTMEIAPQLHGAEGIQVVVRYRVTRPLEALIGISDIPAYLDDRTQAALRRVYGSETSCADIGAAISARLGTELREFGVDIVGVDVSQRGHVIAIKMLNDWATHQSGDLSRSA